MEVIIRQNNIMTAKLTGNSAPSFMNQNRHYLRPCTPSATSNADAVYKPMSGMGAGDSTYKIYFWKDYTTVSVRF